MIENISLNMIVYNEAHRVIETLERIAPHVDHIVVVDQESTDNTYDLCKDFGVDVLIQDRHWGFCEPSRGLAAGFVPEDYWILVLDADEHISKQFAAEMRTLDEDGYKGAMLQRSFWLNGEHRFTGDHQFRFFKKNSAMFLPDLHTDPRPFGISTSEIYATDYIAIWHTKSWKEQIRDELSYEKLIEGLDPGPIRERWSSLNVHLPLVREKGLNPEEVDAMDVGELEEHGMAALNKDFEGNPWEN